MSDTVHVLVVDDTIIYRQIVSSVVEQIPGCEVAGTAPNGKIALAKCASLKPDLVLLDVSMPEMDGLEALQHLREDHPDVDVIMVSGVDTGTADMTMRALKLGALDFIPKPQGTSSDESMQRLKASLTPLISLVKTRSYSRRTKEYTAGKRTPALQPPETTETTKKTPVVQPPTPAERITRRQLPARIDAIALGVSTGGPNALQKIIPLIAASLPVPILAVQHMPPMFTASLAERLDKDSHISVKEGRDGMQVEKGVMYIAPGGRHMVVRRGGPLGMLGINDSPPVNSCRPSVDVLFRSMAMEYGGNILSVVLTGMGNDGAAGVSALRRKGAYSIVQDEATSVVWGMPQAVAAAGDADEVIPLDRIAHRIMEIINKVTG